MMVGIIGIVPNIVGGDMTDRETIKNILLRNEDNWVCSSVFLRDHFIKDYAQRISEIKHDNYNGFKVEIQGKKCEMHDHRLFMYKLSREMPDYERNTLF